MSGRRRDARQERNRVLVCEVALWFCPSMLAADGIASIVYSIRCLAYEFGSRRRH
jgi:hypothetical protein